MKFLKGGNQDKGTPIPLPDVKRAWTACFILGAMFWIIGSILWAQGNNLNKGEAQAWGERAGFTLSNKFLHN